MKAAQYGDIHIILEEVLVGAKIANNICCTLDENKDDFEALDVVNHYVIVGVPNHFQLQFE